MKSQYDTIALTQKSITDSVLTEVMTMKSLIQNYVDINSENTLLIKDFIESRLRSVFYDTPSSEKEVQEKVETLLIGKGYSKGLDYDRETGRVMYSGKEFVPDFIIPKFNLDIEIKLCKTKNKKNILIEEINADIPAYKQKYKNVMFLIYDLGIIRDEFEFKRDIEETNDVFVSIVKH